MSETNQEGFKPIETQEELNNIIKERLKRERETTEKRFEGYISPDDHQKAIDEANKAFDDYKKAHESDEQTIADLTAKNKAYETAINGEDEQSIRADAESIKKLVGSGTPLMPTKSTESGGDYDESTAALKTVLNGIKPN